MILKTLWENYYDNFYIFGNKLKEIFVFNYKIIIINLLSKIFFLRFSLLDGFEYIFLVQYYNKEQACPDGMRNWTPFSFGVQSS